MARMPDKFLSCDWGTSSFRLRLASTITNEVIAEIKASTGVKELFERGRATGDSRAGIFAEVMSKHLQELALRHPLNGQPLVISGMASSTIGWKDLPYAKVPLPLDASGLRVETLNWDSPDGLGATYIVSGAATDSDVMRGEECQAIGILAQPTMQEYRQRSLLILPGTHSKHIEIQHGAIKTFRTYMTGELFDTLSKHTVLSATVNTTESVHAHRMEFTAGVKYVRDHGLAASLFKVRARSVLDKVDPGANAAFLSGLLIGSELAEIGGRAGSPPVVVATSEPLLKLYVLARPRGARIVFTSEIDRATLIAHKLLLAGLFK